MVVESPQLHTLSRPWAGAVEAWRKSVGWFALLKQVMALGGRSGVVVVVVLRGPEASWSPGGGERSPAAPAAIAVP